MNPISHLRHEIRIAIGKLQAMEQDLIFMEAKDVGIPPALAIAAGEVLRAFIPAKSPPPPRNFGRREKIAPPSPDVGTGRRRGRPRKDSTPMASGDARGHGLPVAPEPRIAGAGFEPA